MSVGELKPGAMIDGHYLLVMPLDEKSSSATWQAMDIETGYQVTLTMYDQGGVDEPLIQGFLETMERVKSVQHKNVVDVLGFGRFDDGTIFASMELLDGRSLLDRLTDEPALSLDDLLHSMVQTLDGLTALHQAGLVHGHLKPEIIFLQATLGRPSVKLIGMGRSAIEQRPEGRSLIYASPERVGDSGELDAQSDIYGIGVVTFEALTGKIPFQGKNADEITQAILGQERPPVTAARPELPEELSAVLVQAMSIAPEQRFSSADAMKDALLTSFSNISDELKKSPLPTMQHDEEHSMKVMEWDSGGLGINTAPEDLDKNLVIQVQSKHRRKPSQSAPAPKPSQPAPEPARAEPAPAPQQPSPTPPEPTPAPAEPTPAPAELAPAPATAPDPDATPIPTASPRPAAPQPVPAPAPDSVSPPMPAQPPAAVASPTVEPAPLATPPVEPPVMPPPSTLDEAGPEVLSVSKSIEEEEASAEEPPRVQEPVAATGAAGDDATFTTHSSPAPLSDAESAASDGAAVTSLLAELQLPPPPTSLGAPAEAASGDHPAQQPAPAPPPAAPAPPAAAAPAPPAAAPAPPAASPAPPAAAPAPPAASPASLIAGVDADESEEAPPSFGGGIVSSAPEIGQDQDLEPPPPAPPTASSDPQAPIEAIPPPLLQSQSAQPRKKGRLGLIIGIVITLVLILAILVAVLVMTMTSGCAPSPLSSRDNGAVVALAESLDVSTPEMPPPRR